MYFNIRKNENMEIKKTARIRKHLINHSRNLGLALLSATFMVHPVGANDN
jgi:hypothetical protein